MGFVGGGFVVLEVEEGDGPQLGGDAAGASAAIRVDGVHERLHHGVLGGAQVRGQWVETFPGALACLDGGK